MSITVATAEPVAQVDPRFLSVGLDWAQVTGGEFWDPTGGVDDAAAAGGSTVVDPFVFDRPELVDRVDALGPLYLRLGGTESDQLVYEAAGQEPRAGQTLLTNAQWDRAMAFATSAGAEVLVTLSATHRSTDGSWDPAPARALIGRAVAAGDPVAGWALGNEPNYFTLNYGGPTPGQLGADYAVFADLVGELDPDALVLGPSAAYWPAQGEVFPALQPVLAGAGPVVEVVTWHYYPQQSERCPGATVRADPARALTPGFLDEIATWAAEVEGVRDELAPDAPVWLLETGNAQCGGQPGLSDTARATFWWLDELGQLARRGQPVVVRWNLAGADYALLREPDLEPNPDWWASRLWHQLMGPTVLAAGSEDPDVRAYAHCAVRGPAGAVTVLVLNLAGTDTTVVPEGLDLTGGRRYLVTAPDLGGRTLELEGAPLALGDDGTIPGLEGRAGEGSWVTLPPESWAFVELPEAGAPACG